MFSVFENLKIFLVQSVLTAGLIAAISTPAFSRDGDGRNGPDLKGEAIPVQIERGVKLAQIKEAVSTCLVNPKKKPGLVSVADSLAQLLTNFTLDSRNDVTFDSNSTQVQTKKKVLIESNYSSGQTNDKMFTIHLSTISKKNKTDRLLIRFEIVNEFGISYEDADLLSDRIFPYVKFDRIENNLFYTEVGSVIRNDAIAKGISIIVPANYKKEPLQFKNMTTQYVPPGLLLNVEEYVNCLQAEIYSNAN